MNRIATCDSLRRLSVLVIAINGCASEDGTAVVDDEVAVAGPWTLPASVHTAAQTQFVAYDEPPPWDGGIHCSGGILQGAQKLQAYLPVAFSGISSIGGYSCRQNTANLSQTSVHGTGRALDVMIPTVGGDADNTVGDPIGNWLITHAEEIGIQLVIWDHRVWQASRSGEKLQPYGGPIPHIDHLHVEVDVEAGAREDTAFFRNGIIRIAGGDVNADGYGDILGRKPDGTLWYYANSGNPSQPFSSGVQVGTGWTAFDRVIAADLGGDRFADIVATKPDGTLWYYLNSGIPGQPYGSGRQIGTGWTTFNSVIAADIDGDGRADLVGSKPDGTLWYYVNSGSSTQPYSSGRQIGTGWTAFNKLIAADIDGDGFVDIAAIKPDGTLWYYVNSGNSSQPFSSGLQIGTGWTGFDTVIAADINGDAFADLVGAKPDGTLWYYVNSHSATAPFSSGAQIGTGWTAFHR